MCHFVMSKPQSQQYDQNRGTHINVHPSCYKIQQQKKKKNSTIERIQRFFFFSLVRKAFPVEIILEDWLGIDGVEPRVRNLITTNDMPFLCWEKSPGPGHGRASVFIKANNVITIHRYHVWLNYRLIIRLIFVGIIRPWRCGFIYLHGIKELLMYHKLTIYLVVMNAYIDTLLKPR